MYCMKKVTFRAVALNQNFGFNFFGMYAPFDFLRVCVSYWEGEAQAGDLPFWPGPWL